MFKVRPLFIKQIKLFLLPFATILIVVILTGRFLLPKIGEFQETFSQNKQREDQLNLLQEKAQKLTQLKNSQLLTDFERLEAILPSEKKIPFLISSISLLQSENNLLPEELVIRPGLLKDENTKTGGESIDFSLSVSGPEEGVLNFLEKILITAPLMNIKGVSIVINDGIYKISSKVLTFYQSLPETLGKIDDPLKEISPSQKKTVETIASFTILKEIPEEFIIEASPSSETKIEKSIFD